MRDIYSRKFLGCGVQACNPSTSWWKQELETRLGYILSLRPAWVKTLSSPLSHVSEMETPLQTGIARNTWFSLPPLSKLRESISKEQDINISFPTYLLLKLRFKLRG
jgi:hypothetical protein